MNLKFLYIWLIVMVIVTITAPIVRKKRGLNALDTEDFVVAGFALGSAMLPKRLVVGLQPYPRLWGFHPNYKPTCYCTILAGPVHYEAIACRVHSLKPLELQD